MARNERTDLGDTSDIVINQYLEEFRAVSERMGANGGKLTRRDFMKLSAAGVLGFFLSACKAGTLTPRSPETTVVPTNEPPKPTPTIASTESSPKPTATRPPEMTPTLSETYPRSLSELKPVPDLTEAEFLKKYPDPSLKKEYDLLKTKWIEGLRNINVSEKDVVFTVNEFAWNGGYSWILDVTGKDGSVYVPRDTVSHVRMIDHSAYQNAMKGVAFTVEKLPFPEFHNFEYEIVHGRSEKGWMAMMLRKRGTKDQLAWYDMRADVAKWKDGKDQPVVLRASILQEAENYPPEEQKMIDELRKKLATATEKGMFYASTQGRIEDENGFCWPLKVENITLGIRDCYLSDGKTKKKVATAWRREDGAYLLEGTTGGFIVAKPKETGIRLAQLDFNRIQPEIRNALSGGWVNTEKTYLGLESISDNTVFLPYMKGGCYVDKDDINLLSFNYLQKRPSESFDSVSYWSIKRDIRVNNESLKKLIESIEFYNDAMVPIDKNASMYKDRADKLIAALNLCFEIMSDREKAVILSVDKISFVLSSKSRYFVQFKVLGDNESVISVPTDISNLFLIGNRLSLIGLLSYLYHESIHAVSKKQTDSEFMPYMKQLEICVRNGSSGPGSVGNAVSQLLRTGSYA